MQLGHSIFIRGRRGPIRAHGSGLSLILVVPIGQALECGLVVGAPRAAPGQVSFLTSVSLTSRWEARNERAAKGQRLSIFLEIKEIDHKPVGNTFLLNISDSRPKIETPRKYASGDFGGFQFCPSRDGERNDPPGARGLGSTPSDKPEASLVGLEFSAPWEVGRRST